MSITDELREEVRGFGLYVYTAPQAERLTAIADRIDAEHEAKVSYWQGASYKDGYDEGFASADDWLGQHEDAMAEHGWVRLPRDADNAPWNPGDRDEDGNVVIELWLTSDGWWVCAGGVCRRPDRLRHYHAPTVEDALTEFTAKLIERSGLTNGAAQTITEFAAKLRLAGEDA